MSKKADGRDEHVAQPRAVDLRHGGAQRDALLVAHRERGAGHALRRPAGHTGGGEALLGIFLRGVGMRGDPVLTREAGVVIRQLGGNNVELALKVPAGKRLRHRQEPVGKQAREQRRAVERDDDGGQLCGAEDQAAA